MQFKEFFDRFGGSARTKHILPADLDASKKKSDRRRFLIPIDSELPKEFIRLCPWEMEYLFTVAQHARVGILETGRFNGGSLFVMACAAATSVPIFSIDISPQNDLFLRGALDKHRPKSSIDLIVGDSQHTKYRQIGKVDLLFIDGDHTYDGCMNDIRNWYEHLTDNGHLVFHDAYLGSHGVQKAIVDFMRDHQELKIVQPPYIGAAHWHYPTGSIAHLIKRA